MRLLGLFDRPADPDAIDALLKTAPPIPALTGSIKDIRGRARSKILKRLRDLKLLSAPSKENSEYLYAHPLVREYFREQLRERFPDSWAKANKILYEHFKGATEKLPNNITEMDPLFRATVYGCKAGMHEAALKDVFIPRIMRGNRSYATQTLGALLAVLDVLAYFFTERDFSGPVADTLSSVADQRQVLTEAALCLTAAKGYAAHEAEECYKKALALSKGPADSDLQHRFVITHGLCVCYRARGKLQQSTQKAGELLDMVKSMRGGKHYDRFSLAAHRAMATNLYLAGEFRKAKGKADVVKVEVGRKQTLESARQFINEPGIGCIGYSALADWFLVPGFSKASG
jgi:hypothetical protein